MKSNGFTDREFWKSYWEKYEFEKVPSKVPFQKFLSKLRNKDSFIEIGGFPGIFSAYFYSKGYKKVSLLDFYIDEAIVRKCEKINSLPENTIHCIEADFFTYSTKDQYDLVFSFGFIEHFQDTKDVLQRHVSMLANQGRLLIILPNFKGLNGLVQYLFDKENLKAHNLDCMKPALLKSIALALNLKNITVEYSRKPMVWLEPNVSSIWVRKFIKLCSYALKLFPIKCRILSPYIILYAEK